MGPFTPAHDDSGATRARAAYGVLPLAFEENRGQSAADARFLVRGQGYRLFLTAGAAVLDIAAPVRRHAPGDPTGDSLPGPTTAMSPTTATSPTATMSGTTTGSAPATMSGTVLRLAFLGANPSPRIEGAEPLAATVSYLLGSDQARWRTGVPTYGRVVYHDLYPGIDLAYDGTQGRLEDTYTIAPGADPGAIGLGVTGATAVRLDGARLVLDTAQGPVVEQAPVAYQEIGGARQDVPARYTLDEAGRVGFALGAYDHGRPLVIDPVLAYSTYLGGNTDDEGEAITVDAQGGACVAGETSSPDYPTTTGAYSTTLAGQFDAFVTVLNPQGTARLWSTYLGGTGFDVADGVAVDVSGTVYLTGGTSSTDFPLRHAYQTTYGGGLTNAFVTRLSADGRTLLYSSYLGGGYNDQGTAIVADGAGQAYVTGLAQSPTFPTTANAYQRAIAGTNCSLTPFAYPSSPCEDAFVARVDTTASGVASLPYSSFLGGTGNDTGEGIALNGTRRVSVAGTAGSASFPTKGGLATQAGYAYAATFDLTQSGTASLVYSTKIGGDNGHAIAVDGQGRVYVAGFANQTPIAVVNAAQPAPGGGGDAFVVTLNPAGNAIVYATYLGGSGYDTAAGIALDGATDAYVTGNTTSATFPTTANAPQRTYGGGEGSYGDVFVTELAPTGSALVNSTYLGGSGGEYGRGIAVDNAGGAYVTGPTDSPNFPTSSPLQGTLTASSGNYNAFVTKLLAPRSGMIPWHPHHTVNVGGAFDVAIDLADGHADIATHDLTIPGR
ncbi:MAG: SBBP repeat-containing protein, partial [Chloroflexota bacterium]|nr:SBBP repeat-containing protein [Chloroflexota bacterium]